MTEDLVDIERNSNVKTRARLHILAEPHECAFVSARSYFARGHSNPLRLAGACRASSCLLLKCVKHSISEYYISQSQHGGLNGAEPGFYSERTESFVSERRRGRARQLVQRGAGGQQAGVRGVSGGGQECGQHAGHSRGGKRSVQGKQAVSHFDVCQNIDIV